MYRALESRGECNKSYRIRKSGDTKIFQRMEYGQPVRQKGQDVL